MAQPVGKEMTLDDVNDLVQNSQKETDLLDQLIALREVTRLTGVIHEAQLLQLQNFPWVVLENIKNFEIQFSHEDKILQYVIKSNRQVIQKLKERLHLLCTWVKELFGYDYLCRVVIDGKVVYEE